MSILQSIDPSEDVLETWITDGGYWVESRNSIDQPRTWRVAIAIPKCHFNYIQLRRLWDDRLKPDQIVQIREQDLISRQVRGRWGTVIEWQHTADTPPWDWITETAKRASLDLAIYQRYHDTPPPFLHCPAPVREIYVPLPFWFNRPAPQSIRPFDELQQGSAEWTAARNGQVGASGMAEFLNRPASYFQQVAPLHSHSPEDGVNPYSFSLQPSARSSASRINASDLLPPAGHMGLAVTTSDDEPDDDMPSGPPPLMRQMAMSDNVGVLPRHPALVSLFERIMALENENST
jgi:hypothetical protein